MKQKRGINCSDPRGFSQRNYCKRQKRGGDYLESFKEWLEINEIQVPPPPPPPASKISSKNIQTMASPPLPPPPPQKIDWKMGGWKIHLRTGLDDKVRDRAYQIVLNLVAQNGNKWGHKKLHGGDPDEKDITIYCGSRQEANLAAQMINSHKELRSLLLPAKGDTLGDDMELIPGSGIYGRFDVKNLKTSPYNFTQYGCMGWPMLVDDMNNKIWGKLDYDPCKRAHDVLSRLFGKAFTG